MCKPLKEIALMKCRISDVLHLDEKNLTESNETLKTILKQTDDGIGKELVNEDNHTCRMNAYEVKMDIPNIKRSISKGTKCWCSCDNHEQIRKISNKNKNCMCNCGMLFNLIIERREKDAQSKILAGLIDHLCLSDVLMIPDLTKGTTHAFITVEDALKKMPIYPEYKYLDRIINY